MSESTPAPSGIIGSLRTLGDGLLASVQDRVALLGLELEEEKLRLIQAFAWIGAAIVVGAMVLAFASLTLVFIFWHTARIAVFASLAGFYLLLLALILNYVRQILTRRPRVFAASLAEIEADRKCLRGES